MNTVENALLQQMQKMAANLAAIQSVAGKDKGNQAAVSFQEMMQQQSGGKVSAESGDKDAAPEKQQVKDPEEAPREDKTPIQNQDKKTEELKPENLAAIPNAISLMDLFRPEIVEDISEPTVETVLDPIPQEAVEEADMDLNGQTADLETTVDSGVGAEVSMEQRQPHDFRETMEEAPRQQQAQTAETKAVKTETTETEPTETEPAETETVTVKTEVAETRQAAPEQTVEREDKPDSTFEAHVEVRQKSEEAPSGETAAPEQPVFHETKAVPVKVGERYETVDTQKPDMDDHLADSIHTAVQTGQDRVEIRLTPQNLGSLVIEMTRDTNGVLQVVLHASTPRAEGLLNQHLNHLQTALQGYGHEDVRLEVQRNQESQQQHFRQADPDGRGQQQRRQHQERQEEQTGGEEFLQKLRLGLFGAEE